MTFLDTELFLGGPADGRRQHIAPNTNDVSISAGDEIVRYRRELIVVDQATFAFWLHIETSPDEALAQLFLGYKARG